MSTIKKDAIHKSDPIKQAAAENVEITAAGKIFDRAVIVKSVNDAFDDFEAFKAEHLDAQIHGVSFIMVSHSKEKGTAEVQCSIGGNRELLLAVFKENYQQRPTQSE